MKNLLVLCVFAFLFMSGCGRSKLIPKVISKPSRFSDFTLSVDTVRIGINEFQKFVYPKFGTIRHNDSLHLIGYNEQTHAFDFFNLDGEYFIKSIKLQKEGPHAIKSVVGFTPLDIDRLYILSTYQISLVNNSGSIQEKISINVPSSPISNHNSDKNMFWLETDEPLHYDARTNSLYGMNHSYLHGLCDPKRYKGASLISRLDLNKLSMSTLPIGYPTDKQEFSYGFINKMFTQWTEDRLIYNFQNDPNIYVMDRGSEKLNIYDGRSEYTNNKVSPISWGQCQDFSKAQRHYVDEVNFGKVLNDPYNGMLYRFHRKELTGADLGKLNINKKKLFLSFFDDRYSKVGEFILDNRPYLSDVAFAGEKGLYVSAPEGTEETLVFYVFQISLIE